ncbi:hypothetical protein TBLA_0A01140 [Henningerozyma blattae CBS 6284]|uniref:Uncharacterized protein n=1 Tax=Henningerozyma blattae (strain ATCC 34711 / CBS 6284 / DSM 70876 / NBRC 10599 / NRRL Y-10934 / UCD 77-7) TaxID=1071380 RepID=I2GUW2_HENB6|nr:hypothetical protein TBLA_0A01140 [Tetrapisispora blattae CBS 6284]CCH57914.1 hypothetical protein TBLA_0A01140 [Tetrapisispora blattae CBS 6284]
MSFAKFVTLLIAAATSAYAISPEDQVSEMQIILSDVNDNLQDYVGLVGSMDIPQALFDLYAIKATATDDSYTKLMAQLDMNQISAMLTVLPWYSSRLEAKVAQFGEAAATTTSSKVETISSKVGTISSKVETASSKVETASSKVETTITSSIIASSSKTESSTEVAKTSTTTIASETSATPSGVATSTLKEQVAVVSQIGDGQIQATVIQQTENGAIKNAVGLGAGLAAAAALLL